MASDAQSDFDVEAWLRRHAGVAESLKTFIANQSQFRQLLVSATTTPLFHPPTPVDSSGSVVDTPGLPLSPFGPYDVLREIGRGGMGIVYAARHRQLKRDVALKVLKLGRFAAESDRRRLQREAESVAKLDHTRRSFRSMRWAATTDSHT